MPVSATNKTVFDQIRDEIEMDRFYMKQNSNFSVIHAGDYDYDDASVEYEYSAESFD